MGKNCKNMDLFHSSVACQVPTKLGIVVEEVHTILGREKR